MIEKFTNPKIVSLGSFLAPVFLEDPDPVRLDEDDEDRNFEVRFDAAFATEGHKCSIVAIILFPNR